MSKHKGPPASTPATHESRRENEGGASLPPAHVAAAALARAGNSGRDQPRLYADLLAEADRLRQAADTVLARGMVAIREPRR